MMGEIFSWIPQIKYRLIHFSHFDGLSKAIWGFEEQGQNIECDPGSMYYCITWHKIFYSFVILKKIIIYC